MKSPLQIINKHYQAIINKNIDVIHNKYFPAEETYVVLEGPRLSTTGFKKIKQGWVDFCASPLKLISIDWVEGPFSDETPEMAWVGGVIKMKLSINEKELENTFRTSFVLVRYEGEWKIKHEHVSVVHPDPYGIGDWLKK